MPCPFLPLLYARSCPISSVLSVPPCSVPPAFAAGALAAIPLPSPVASNQLSPRAQCGLFRGAQEDSHPPLAPGCTSKVSCHRMAKDIATSCRFRRSFAHIGDPGCFQSSAGSRSNPTSRSDTLPWGTRRPVCKVLLFCFATCPHEWLSPEINDHSCLAAAGWHEV